MENKLQNREDLDVFYERKLNEFILWVSQNQDLWRKVCGSGLLSLEETIEITEELSEHRFYVPILVMLSNYEISKEVEEAKIQTLLQYLSKSNQTREMIEQYLTNLKNRKKR